MDEPPAPERATHARSRAPDDALAPTPWPSPTRAMTHWAVAADLSPGQVRLGGAVLSLMVALLWRGGWYWTGMAAALVVMLLGRVAAALDRDDGDIAPLWDRRLGIGLDWLVPPLWWWTWIAGLDAADRPLEPVYALMILGALVFGHVAERIMARIFLRRYDLAIDAWRPIDSRFRRIAAGRDTDLAILIVSLPFGRPDRGIELVALWTLCSLMFHSVRLAMANDRRAHGKRVRAWRK